LRIVASLDLRRITQRERPRLNEEHRYPRWNGREHCAARIEAREAGDKTDDEAGEGCHGQVLLLGNPNPTMKIDDEVVASNTEYWLATTNSRDSKKLPRLWRAIGPLSGVSESELH
jgi:hypothetical protein